MSLNQETKDNYSTMFHNNSKQYKYEFVKPSVIRKSLLKQHQFKQHAAHQKKIKEENYIKSLSDSAITKKKSWFELFKSKPAPKSLLSDKPPSQSQPPSKQEATNNWNWWPSLISKSLPDNLSETIPSETIPSETIPSEIEPLLSESESESEPPSQQSSDILKWLGSAFWGESPPENLAEPLKFAELQSTESSASGDPLSLEVKIVPETIQQKLEIISDVIIKVFRDNPSLTTYISIGALSVGIFCLGLRSTWPKIKTVYDTAKRTVRDSIAQRFQRKRRNLITPRFQRKKRNLITPPNKGDSSLSRSQRKRRY